MQIFICGWWMCPELFLRRPFRDNASSRLDSLLESKAKQGVQVIKKKLDNNNINQYSLEDVSELSY